MLNIIINDFTKNAYSLLFLLFGEIISMFLVIFLGDIFFLGVQLFLLYLTISQIFKKEDVQSCYFKNVSICKLILIKYIETIIIVIPIIVLFWFICCFLGFNSFGIMDYRINSLIISFIFLIVIFFIQMSITLPIFFAFNYHTADWINIFIEIILIISYLRVGSFLIEKETLLSDFRSLFFYKNIYLGLVFVLITFFISMRLSWWLLKESLMLHKINFSKSNQISKT